MKQGSVENIQVFIYDDRTQMGCAAAHEVKQHIVRLLQSKESINMIFAAAPSQNEFLKELAEDKEIDFSRINAFHMDEYIGLSPDAPQGFGNFLKERLFSRCPFRSVNYINGNAQDIEKECERYANLLKQNPPDIVCGGIGENGHIAFNDPAVADFKDPVRIKSVSLDQVCRQQQVNDGCFRQLDDVPTHALTLTIPALLSAPCKVFTVPAASKAQAVYNVLFGPVSESVPASALREEKECSLYLDDESAALIAGKL